LLQILKLFLIIATYLLKYQTTKLQVLNWMKICYKKYILIINIIVILIIKIIKNVKMHIYV
jgi:hypothetical protein